MRFEVADIKIKNTSIIKLIQIAVQVKSFKVLRFVIYFYKSAKEIILKLAYYICRNYYSD